MNARANIVALGSLLGTLVFGVFGPGVAEARGYGLRATTTMSSRGVEQPAVKLVPGVAGWYLVLDLPGDGKTCKADLKDVSPLEGPLPKWQEPVPNWAAHTTVLLSPDRYVASHTYRMTLTCGMHELAVGLVHLQVPSDEKVQMRFQLKNDEGTEHGWGSEGTHPRAGAAGGSELSEIVITPKPAL